MDNFTRKYKHSKFLNAIARFSYDPTLREIAAVVGCSLTTAHYNINQLVESGILAKHPENGQFYIPGEQVELLAIRTFCTIGIENIDDFIAELVKLRDK